MRIGDGRGTSATAPAALAAPPAICYGFRMPRIAVCTVVAAGLVLLACLQPTTGRATQAEAPAVVLPATGQTESHPAARPGAPEPVAVPDDGRVRAGAPMRFRDNRDGTVSDLITGLMWEKKCASCDGAHSRKLRLRWSGDGSEATVWDWLDELNGKGAPGFAGFQDWRIPNVKELVSIVDYGRVNPAVDEAFLNDGCWAGCGDVTSTSCSCTVVGEYWTSTTFSDFPAHALIVDLGVGFVDDRLKTNRHFVRAVRGGQ